MDVFYWDTGETQGTNEKAFFQMKIWKVWLVFVLIPIYFSKHKYKPVKSQGYNISKCPKNIRP